MDETSDRFLQKLRSSGINSQRSARKSQNQTYLSRFQNSACNLECWNTGILFDKIGSTLLKIDRIHSNPFFQISNPAFVADATSAK
jgi:hypothetical protein